MAATAASTDHAEPPLDSDAAFDALVPSYLWSELESGLHGQDLLGSAAAPTASAPLRDLWPDTDDDAGYAPPGTLEPMGAAIASAVLYRCIDKSHPANCARCTPPPSVDEECLYALVGDAGKKNGEKKLRALLTHTDEWIEPEQRRLVVGKVRGDPLMRALVLVMTNEENCSTLCKRHLLFLTRFWGYRSDVWQLRNSKLIVQTNTMSSSAPRTAEGDDEPSAAPRPGGRLSATSTATGSSGGRPSGRTSDTVMRGVTSDALSEMTRPLLHLFRGVSAQEAAKEHGSAFLTHQMVTQCELMAQDFMQLCERLEVIRNELAADSLASTTLDGGGAASKVTPAAPGNHPLEVVLHELRRKHAAAVLHVSACLAAEQLQPSAPEGDAAAALLESVVAAEAVWLRELQQGLLLQRRFFDGMLDAVATLRSKTPALLNVGMLRLCDVLDDNILNYASALSTRAAWIRDVLEANPKPDVVLSRPSLLCRWLHGGAN